MGTALSKLDHLVHVTPDLQNTVDALSRTLGVVAAPGGRHPGWGTRNALLGLGPTAYLEIMGPDPESSPSDRKRPFGIDGLTGARLATWVVRSQRLHDVAATARAHGIDLGEVQSRSRQRPDGSLLAWTMTDLTADREGGIIPCFIDWGDSVHPAQAAPSGCRLIGLRAVHPEPERIGSILESLGLDLPIQGGKGFELAAEIETPNGLVWVS
jgi:hypothetical protein